MASYRNIRALFVINSLAGGGAERVFSTLIREINAAPQGLSLTVALLDDEESEAYSLPSGVDVVRLQARGGMLRSVTQLRSIVSRLRPDVTVSFLSRANVASIMAMWRTGNPTIISERVNTTAHLRSGRFSSFSKTLIRTLYPTAQKVIAVSEGVARTLEVDFDINPDRIEVIYNPVDIQQIRERGREMPAIPVSREDFVTMGRLVPNKNTALAIRALAASTSPGRLIVLGEGPMRQELEELSASLGLTERVRFAGFVKNPHAVLARAGGYLLTSDAEGFPNAMLEAMACGLPVIATDCPSGPAEILQVTCDGSEPTYAPGGALVPMNAPQPMAKAMDRLMVEPDRSAAAQGALERASAFSVERAVAHFRTTITQSVSNREVHGA